MFLTHDEKFNKKSIFIDDSCFTWLTLAKHNVRFYVCTVIPANSALSLGFGLFKLPASRLILWLPAVMTWIMMKVSPICFHFKPADKRKRDALKGTLKLYFNGAAPLWSSRSGNWKARSRLNHLWAKKKIEKSNARRCRAVEVSHNSNRSLHALSWLWIKSWVWLVHPACFITTRPPVQNSTACSRLEDCQPRVHFRPVMENNRRVRTLLNVTKP